MTVGGVGGAPVYDPRDDHDPEPEPAPAAPARSAAPGRGGFPPMSVIEAAGRRFAEARERELSRIGPEMRAVYERIERIVGDRGAVGEGDVLALIDAAAADGRMSTDER